MTRLSCVELIYPSLSFLDRSNIGNARLAGLERDLGMTGLDYNARNTPTLHFQSTSNGRKGSSRNLLPILRAGGSALESYDEKIPSECLDPIHYGRLGHHVLSHGRCNQLRGSTCHPRGTWICRGRPLSGHHLLVSSLGLG